MTEASRDTRTEATERHLRAALEWLRGNLRRMATRGQPAAVAPRRALGLPLLVRRAGGAVPLIPGPSEGVPAGPLPKPEALLAMERGEPAPALVEVGRRLGLTGFERDLLLFALAPALAPDIRDLCAAAAGDARLGFPTPALALGALPDPGWDALLPSRPLRRLRLVGMEDAAGGLDMQGEMRGAERVLHLLKGCDEPDARLLAMAAPAEEAPLAPSQARRVAEIAAGRGVPVLVGADGATRRALAAALALARGLALMRLPAARVAGDVEAAARLVEREAMLLPLMVLVEFGEGEAPAPAVELARRLSEGMRDAVVVSAPQPPAGIEGGVAWDVARPTTGEQAALWAEALGDAAAGSALASSFDLDAGAIAAIGAATREDGETGDEVAARAREGALAATRPGLDRLAQRVETGVGLKDLVLPEAARRLLDAILAQIAQRARVLEDWGFARMGPRGLGVSVLFAGESGTGKTMAAEALANALGLPLLRIDLASVVSKYIGETEKNLKALFDAAERGGAVLFFDEADALFGRRSEVKDAHDRYANIEIDYLLQRMEAYRGLAILATNMKGALDQAFLRRLRVVVDFPFPGPAERQRLWERAFPGELGKALDHAALARRNLTGGTIRNIALNAAFAAAAAGAEAVSMDHVRDAARMEFAKLDHPQEEIDLPPRVRGVGR